MRLRCALLSCHEPAERVVDHPGRPEGETALCSAHAEAVPERADGPIRVGLPPRSDAHLSGP